MALPTGRPQEKYVGAAVPGGRCAVLPTPRTSSPSRRTRSPIGPHEKGPGSVTSNRHVRLVPSGATAHALPPETNATVSTAAGLPFAQPDGNEATRAVAAGAGEAVGVGDREVGGDGDACVVWEGLLQADAATMHRASAAMVRRDRMWSLPPSGVPMVTPGARPCKWWVRRPPHTTSGFSRWSARPRPRREFPTPRSVRRGGAPPGWRDER